MVEFLFFVCMGAPPQHHAQPTSEPIAVPWNSYSPSAPEYCGVHLLGEHASL